MIKNKFFNKISNQKRVEDTIQKYYDSIHSERIRELLDQMPKNKETLSIIEDELNKLSENVEGTTSKEKWSNIMKGVEVVEEFIGQQKLAPQKKEPDK